MRSFAPRFSFSAGILALAVSAGGAVPLLARQATEADEEAALAAAGAWLELIDGGQYEESWEEASPRFQEAITAEEWASRVDQVAAQIGAFHNRDFDASERITDPPSSPPGEYIRRTYASEFENLAAARELVVLILNEGAWEVAGYVVVPR